TSGSLETYEEFHRAALSVTPEVQLANLAATAFTTRQLVRLKYRHYRRAILFVKLLAAWTGGAVVGIGRLQALGRSGERLQILDRLHADPLRAYGKSGLFGESQ